MVDKKLINQDMAQKSVHDDLTQIIPQAEMDRRSFLGLGAATLGGVILPSLISPALAGNLNSGMVEQGSRRLSFRNAHTGESFSGVYRVGNKYLPDAFKQINMVMRDFRTNQVYPMDPRVIDIVYTVHRMTGKRAPLEILSGYRSPKTNAMLRGKSSASGVAKKSLHMQGQAVDLRMEGFSTARLSDIAASLRAGGVGYYAKSNFVHMDSGDVRTW